MIVDTSALLAILQDEPERRGFNEAIEMAKKFSGDQSPRFVNGVLDAIHKILRPDSARGKP